MPSDWYDENSPAAAMKERKQIMQMKSERRGHRLKTAATEARTPSQQTIINVRSLEPSHSTVGAYHSAHAP